MLEGLFSFNTWPSLSSSRIQRITDGVVDRGFLGLTYLAFLYVFIILLKRKDINSFFKKKLNIRFLCNTMMV